MKEIGDKLRQAREKKNISINEIQERTKIRLRYLEAIESGNLEIIPGEVYRKGFITNYANAVGLDSEELIREYNQYKAGGMVSQSKPVPETQPKTALSKGDTTVTISEKMAKTAAAPTSAAQRQNALRINPVFMGVVAGAVLVGIGILFFPKGGAIKTETITTKQQPTTGIVQPKNGIAIEPTPASLKEEQKEEKEQSATTVQHLYPAPITVYAEFSAEVWVQIKADGQIKYPGSGKIFNVRSPKQLWTANSEMIIRIGNPAGIKLTLNGKDLGPLGEAGKAKTITLTVNGMVES